MKAVLPLVFVIWLIGCATGPTPYIDASHKPTQAQQQDLLECQALASQAASGAGGFWTDVTLRNAAYHQARAQYLAACLQQRGWVWKTGY